MLANVVKHPRESTSTKVLSGSDGHSDGDSLCVGHGAEHGKPCQSGKSTDAHWQLNRVAIVRHAVIMEVSLGVSDWREPCGDLCDATATLQVGRLRRERR